MKITPIKTRDLTLRKFTLRDASVLTEILKDKKISKWLSSLPYPYKLSDAKEWLGKLQKEYKKTEPKFLAFAIEKEGKLIGSIGLHKIIIGHKAEIGYWLDPNYWGKDLMPKAVKKICQFGFKELKLCRIAAKVFVGNIGSEKVLKKNGFKHEGLLRKETKKKSRFHDVNLFAKTK